MNCVTMNIARTIIRKRRSGISTELFRWNSRAIITARKSPMNGPRYGIILSMPDANPTTIASCGSIFTMNISPILLRAATNRDSSDMPTKYLDSKELMDLVALRTFSSRRSGTKVVSTLVIRPFSINRKKAIKTMENTAMPKSVRKDARETIMFENVLMLMKFRI